MMHRVHITEEAEKDLLDLWSYVAASDDAGKADALLDHLEEVCGNLAHSPDRGHIPPEMERLGIEAYREIHHKPYRVIYEVVGRDVFVYAVVDGRRDLQAFLERRLLR
jgi:toxin ParE1/3/4